MSKRPLENSDLERRDEQRVAEVRPIFRNPPNLRRAQEEESSGEESENSEESQVVNRPDSPPVVDPDTPNCWYFSEHGPFNPRNKRVRKVVYPLIDYDAPLRAFMSYAQRSRGWDYNPRTGTYEDASSSDYLGFNNNPPPPQYENQQQAGQHGQQPQEQQVPQHAEEANNFNQREPNPNPRPDFRHMCNRELRLSGIDLSQYDTILGPCTCDFKEMEQAQAGDSDSSDETPDEDDGESHSNEFIEPPSPSASPEIILPGSSQMPGYGQRPSRLIPPPDPGLLSELSEERRQEYIHGQNETLKYWIKYGDQKTREHIMDMID